MQDGSSVLIEYDAAKFFTAEGGAGQMSAPVGRTVGLVIRDWLGLVRLRQEGEIQTYWRKTQD